MLTCIIYFFCAIIFILVFAVAAYGLYLYVSGIFAHDEKTVASGEETRLETSVNDTLLAYIDDHHSPLSPVRFDDHLFATLGMDSLDVAEMLRFMSNVYDVELPIVDLFGRYGSDPTVYQVLCYISRQRHANS